MLNLPAIDCYCLNLKLRRQPRCLFSTFNSTHTLYSVDKDVSIRLNLPFNPSKSAWVYTPCDTLVITGGENSEHLVYEVKMMDRAYEDLPKMNSRHVLHAAVLWGHGLLVAGGEDSNVCEMLVGGEWKILGSLNRSRQRHVLVTAEQTLYAVGGSHINIEKYWNDTWEDVSFSLPHIINHPTVTSYQGSFLLLGGASESFIQHKSILQINFSLKQLTDTGVTLYLVTWSNCISRQGDNLICLDFKGNKKHLSRPDSSSYPLPHSYCIDCFNADVSIGEALPVLQEELDDFSDHSFS